MSFHLGTATDYHDLLEQLIEFATADGLQTVDSIDDGGTGYAVNDILTVVGGPHGTAAQFKVTTAGGGIVSAVTLQTAGDYAQTPSNAAATTGGGGTGCTLNVTYQDVTTSQEHEAILMG